MTLLPADLARPPRRLPGRVPAALLLAATLALFACDRGARAPGAAEVAPGDARGRLSALLRQGAQPGELTPEERREAERLVRDLLPEPSGPLAGYSWDVTYDDLPSGDFVSIELLRPGKDPDRDLWMHLIWRGELPAKERAAYRPAAFGRWPARGDGDHHLFVLAGAVELRAVADSDAFRQPGKLRAMVEQLDLAALAEL